MKSASDSIRGREDHLRKGSDVTPYEALMAGSISGAIARGVTAPLDTIKIRLQLQTQSFQKYNGATGTLINICKKEGIRALWKGNVPAEILYILYGATQFTAYSVFSKALSDFENNQTKRFSFSPATHSLVVGAGAGLCSTLLTYPFDLLRTRLAANSDTHFLSMITTARQIMSNQGIGAFWRGLNPALISVASTTGLMFWSYELAREFSRGYKDTVPFIEGFCGFVAGATAKGITFPLDTLRKRIQMYSKTHAGEGTPVKALKLFKSILVDEGIFGFYKGFGVSILKSAPTSALSLFIYEYSLNSIREFSKKEKLS